MIQIEMDMPKSCAVCPFNSRCDDCDGASNYCMARKEKMKVVKTTYPHVFGKYGDMEDRMDKLGHKAAIDEIEITSFDDYGDYMRARELIEELPPAYPKKGKWIYTRYYTWECSECKKNPTLGTGYVQNKDELFEFCPHCGADMIGESE